MLWQAKRPYPIKSTTNEERPFSQSLLCTLCIQKCTRALHTNPPKKARPGSLGSPAHLH